MPKWFKTAPPHPEPTFSDGFSNTIQKAIRKYGFGGGEGRLNTQSRRFPGPGGNGFLVISQSTIPKTGPGSLAYRFCEELLFSTPKPHENPGNKLPFRPGGRPKTHLF
jgi:hypothetical protein